MKERGFQPPLDSPRHPCLLGERAAVVAQLDRIFQFGFCPAFVDLLAGFGKSALLSMIPRFAAEEVTCFSRERHVHADDFAADAQRIDDFARLFAQERRRLEGVHAR